MVFAVPHPDRGARARGIYPAFQFEDHKPIAAVRAVLEAFGKRNASWKLALWFTSNNGWLPDNARPVDLRVSDPRAVVEAARRDAEPAAETGQATKDDLGELLGGITAQNLHAEVSLGKPTGKEAGRFQVPSATVLG